MSTLRANNIKSLNDFNVDVETISNERQVDSVADLRTSTFPASLERLWLSGYYGVGTAGGGPLYRDSADTTTADNGFTVFVDEDGVRWKRSTLARYPVTMAGARDGQDSTNALQAAISSELPLDFVGGNYIVSDDIGQSHSFSGVSPNWVGNGAKITLDSPTKINSVCQIQVQNANAHIRGIEIDCAQLAIRGLHIRNTNGDIRQENTSANVYLDRVVVRNATSDVDQGQNGAPIIVVGAFNDVFIHNSKVINTRLLKSDRDSGRTATCINVTHSSAGLWSFPLNVQIKGCTLDTLESDDPSVNAGMNMISCFAPHVDFSEEEAPLKTICKIENCRFLNGWGASIKTQQYYASVVDCEFYRDTSGPTTPGRSEIRVQVGGGEIRNCRAVYTGAVPTHFVSHTTTSNSKEVENHLGVYNCSIINATSTRMRSVLHPFVGAAGAPSCHFSIEDCSAIGPFNRFAYADISGSDPGADGDLHTRVQLRNCIADDLSLGDNDLSVGETVPHFLQHRNVRGTSGTVGYVTMQGCIYSGSSDCYAIWNRTNTLHINGSGNKGFLVNMPSDGRRFADHLSGNTTHASLATIDDDEGGNGGSSLTTQAVGLVSDGMHVFYPRGVNQNCLMVMINFGEAGAPVGVIVQLTSSGVSETYPLPASVATGGSTEPTNDVRWRLWRDSDTGGLAIRNRSGLTRRVTIATL